MVVSDETIARLIEEPKPPLELERLLPKTEKRAHLEAQMGVSGRGGTSFRVIVRRLRLDPFDFSVILGYDMPTTNRLFRLLRLNGSSHVHVNRLEGTNCSSFHVHRATERYQLAGFREEAYAESTDAYADVTGALEVLGEVASFEPPRETRLEFTYGDG